MRRPPFLPAVLSLLVALAPPAALSQSAPGPVTPPVSAEPAPPARGTVVVFHGNAGHVGHRAFYAAIFTRLGWRVILAEYPGYGPRGGQVGERPLVEDAEQTLRRAVELAPAEYTLPAGNLEYLMQVRTTAGHD